MTIQPPPIVYFGQQPPPPTSGLATTAMIMGIIGALGGWCMFGIPCFIAVMLGHMAMKETSTGQRGGHGMAVTALVLGYPFAVLWALAGVPGIIGGVTT